MSSDCSFYEHIDLNQFLQFSLRYQTWFLGNKVSVHVHRDTHVG